MFKADKAKQKHATHFYEDKGFSSVRCRVNFDTPQNVTVKIGRNALKACCGFDSIQEEYMLRKLIGMRLFALKKSFPNGESQIALLPQIIGKMSETLCF